MISFHLRQHLLRSVQYSEIYLKFCENFDVIFIFVKNSFLSKIHFFNNISENTEPISINLVLNESL